MKSEDVRHVEEAGSWEAGYAAGLKEGERERERLKAENDVHRARLIVDVLQEVHDPKRRPMTVEQAEIYMRRLFAEALRRRAASE